MIKSNTVKALIGAGQPAFGTWITLCPHPRVVKMLGSAGFDFVIIETEHTDFSSETVGLLAMYAREVGITPIVRPAGTLKPHDLTRPLDAGAQGLLLPSIDTPEQMRAIVKATKYTPLGNRPMNLRGPHTDYQPGIPAETIAHLNRETLLIAMVETRTAIDNLDAICTVEGLDCVMVGPDDLSQDLGVPGEMTSPVLAEAMDEIFAICARHDMPYGVSAQSPEMAAKWIEKGVRFIPYQNDAAMVFNTAKAAVPQLMKIGGRA